MKQVLTVFAFKTSFCLFFLLLFITLMTACSKETATATNSIQQAIDKSAFYLINNTAENGFFNYRINMEPDIKVRESYNILRHAGAIYAMSMYYQLKPDPKTLSAMERAGKYLQQHAIAPVEDHVKQQQMLAVWSEPSVNKRRHPRQAKLGGTGLGLVALMGIEKNIPGFTPLADLQALARFIVFMQKENGSFYSKYIPENGGKDKVWQSLYYPGEAALGLLMLYEKDPKPLWLETAYKALFYLADSRKNSHNIPADHWALLATAKLFSLKNTQAVEVSTSLLLNHALAVCDVMLLSQIKKSTSTEYIGGFSLVGKTTPSATRLEGLQAVLSLLPKGHEKYPIIKNAVSNGINFLQNAQIKQGQYAGAFPRAVKKIAVNNNKKTEKFNLRVNEVRIDYVQHALSAMIQYAGDH